LLQPEAGPGASASAAVRNVPGKYGDVIFLSLGVLGILLTWSIFYFVPDKSILVLLDASEQTYPWWMYSVSEVQQGRLPLWDPYTVGGMSYVGEVIRSALYPPLLVVALLGEPARSTAAIHAFALAHFLLAFFGAYILGRLLAMPPVGAFGSGLAYSLGGFVARRALGQLAIFNGLAWIPLMLAGLVAVARTRNWKWSLLSGAAMAMSILAGHFQPAIHGAILFGVVAIVICFFGIGGTAPLGIKRTLIASAGASISAACFAAVQLLPAFEYFSMAFRWLGANDPRTGVGSTVASARLPFDVIAMNPRFELRHWPAILYSKVGNVPDGSLYFGIAAVILALIGFQFMKRADRILWLSLFLAGFILGHGSATPLLKLAYLTIPLFDKVREPARHLFLGHVAISVAVGYGVTALWQKRRASSFFFLIVSAAAVLATWRVWTLRGEFPFTVTLALMLLLVVAGIHWFQESRQLRSLFLLPILLLGMFVELGAGWARQIGRISRFDGKTNYAVERWYRSPVVDSLSKFLAARPGNYRIDFVDASLPANLGEILRVPTTAGYSATKPAMFFNLRNLVGWFPPTPGADLLSIRYVFTPRHMPGVRLVGSLEGLNVYENDRALPFAWFVKSVVVSDREERTLSLLRTRQIDPSRTAIVSQRRGHLVRDLPIGSEKSEVRIVAYEPQRVQMETSNPTRGLLVTTDPYYPGWVASIDGLRTSVIRVNYGFRGVIVPPGRHRVEFRYRPLTFRVGAIISMSALVIAALILLLPAALRVYARRER
jgi:hypothetical protein